MEPYDVDPIKNYEEVVSVIPENTAARNRLNDRHAEAEPCEARQCPPSADAKAQYLSS
jgi:hypothetical protein